jgi:teichoic acid transport system permease protein
MRRVWHYDSPVLWFPSDLPSGLHWLLAVNPLGYLLTGWSEVLIRGQDPSALELGVGAAWGVGLLTASVLFFLSRERDLALRL